MESQFNDPNTSDVQLKLIDPDRNSTILFLHRKILSAQSEFFERMFQSGMREAKEEILTLEVPDLEVAIELLKWLYAKEGYLPREAEELAEMWLIMDPTYPGERGIFEHTKGDWEKRHYPGYEYNRILEYRTDSDSLISDFTLFGFKNVSSEIHIEFYWKNKDIVKNYLARFGIRVKEIASYYLQSRDISEIEILTDLVVRNNFFKKEDISMIFKVLSQIKNSH